MIARWRLTIGIAAFILLGPAGLFALPLAALLIASGPQHRLEWTATAVAAGLGLLIVARPAGGVLDAATNAYGVLVTAAFVLLMRYRPGRFFPRAIGAVLIAGTATAALGITIWGSDFVAALHWEAAMIARRSADGVLAMRPGLAAAVRPAVDLVATTLPATVVLETLAGLALAWETYQRTARQPLGPPLVPFRDFRFADQWVWSLVVALAVVIVPQLAALQGAALNLGVVAGTLYLLRGAAIVVAFAQAAGISAGALALATMVAAVLAVPMLVIVPGLWTLGVTDTWVEFRRRLAPRSPGQ